MALYAYRHVVANERTCYRLFHRLRWPRGVRCPRCQSPQVWRLDDRGRCDYRCQPCRYHFSLLTGTALHGSRLPLTEWVLAVALFKVGISSHALTRELQVSERIAGADPHAGDRGLLGPPQAHPGRAPSGKAPRILARLSRGGRLQAQPPPRNGFHSGNAGAAAWACGLLTLSVIYCRK